MPVLLKIRRHITDQLAGRPGPPAMPAAVAVHERTAIIRVFGRAEKIFHMIHGDVEIEVVHATGEDVQFADQLWSYLRPVMLQVVQYIPMITPVKRYSAIDR